MEANVQAGASPRARVSPRAEARRGLLSAAAPRTQCPAYTAGLRRLSTRQTAQVGRGRTVEKRDFCRVRKRSEKRFRSDVSK